MALNLISCRRPSSLNPTSSLNDALKDFDKALSQDERQRYQTNCRKPSAQTVLDFVSEIDVNNQGRGGRCTATRMITFLDAVQQFVVVVDTFVSSNPKVAALVWGGVKTTILIASNVNSYFDTITNLIMDIGRSCPAYQEFGDLFPDSGGLQTALCEYFTVIVKLCIKIIQESHTSSLIYRAFVPLDAVFKLYRNELDRAVRDVQLQILLASQQAAQNERKLSANNRTKNAQLHSSIYKSHINSEQQQAQSRIREAMRLRAAIKQTLYPGNHIKPWKRNRQQCANGTTTWIERDPNLLAWVQSSGSSVLWCSGNLGTGKSVIISSVVAYLHTIRKPSDKLAYFFCQAEDGISLTARSVFGSIVSQLIDSYLEDADNDQLNEVYEESQNFDIEDFALLVSKVKSGGFNYVIIDGLDECDETEGQKVSEVINTVSNTLQVKILCTSRPELETQLFRNIRPNQRIILSGEKVDTDIKRYIEVTLREKLVKGQLTLRDPALFERIEEVLLQGAQGMFLWARLLIEDICAQETDNDIVSVLETPPRGLRELFRRMKKRVASKHGAARAMKVLQLCGVAKQAFTVGQLKEILAVTRGQKDLDRGRLAHDFGRVLADCGSFVFADEEEHTVHYIHHSAKTYLFTKDPDSDDIAFQDAALDKELGILCMTYLNFDAFRGEMARVSSAKGPKHAAIDALDIAKTAISASSESNGKLSARVAQRLLHKKGSLKSMAFQDLEKCSQEILRDIEAARLQSELQSSSFPFLAYAQPHWIFHLKDLDKNDKDSWVLFRKCIENLDIASKPWENHQQGISDLLNELLSDMDRRMESKINTRRNQNLIDWTSRHNHAALLSYLGTSLKTDHALELERRLLICYSTIGQSRLADFLLSTREWQVEELDQAILMAAGMGHLNIVDRLIVANADVNGPTIQDTYYCARKPEDLVKNGTLIRHRKGKFSLSSLGWLGLTTLQAAVRNRHVKVVERLLDANANVSQMDSKDRSLLHDAAELGDTDMLEILLVAASPALINAVDCHRRTALHFAAKRGYVEIVDRLLAAKADVNTGCGDYCTALHVAAEAGHLKVVEKLLTAQPDVWRKSLRGKTALEIASENGHRRVAKRLHLHQQRELCSSKQFPASIGEHGFTFQDYGGSSGDEEEQDLPKIAQGFV